MGYSTEIDYSKGRKKEQEKVLTGRVSECMRSYGENWKRKQFGGL